MNEEKPEVETRQEFARRKLQTQKAVTREMWEQETPEIRLAVTEQRDSGGKKARSESTEAGDGDLEEEEKAENLTQELGARERQK